MVEWKDGVPSKGLNPVMNQAIDLLDSTRLTALNMCSHNSAVITGSYEKGHSAGGLHPKKLALDARTKDFAECWASVLREQLGAGWDVVVEDDHLHIERDTKKLPL